MIRSFTIIALLTISVFAQDKKPAAPVTPPPPPKTFSINNAERVALTSIVEKIQASNKRVDDERVNQQAFDKMYKEVNSDICLRLFGGGECTIQNDGTVIKVEPKPKAPAAPVTPAK